MTHKTLEVNPECYGPIDVSFEGELLTKQEISVDRSGKMVYEFYKVGEGIVLSVVRFLKGEQEIASFSAYASMSIGGITRALNNCQAIDGSLPGIVQNDLENYLPTWR